jgi:16S rRNA (uracil1498-N3)-methyltransferase
LNLILFDRAEINLPLPIGDTRAVHSLSVLRRQIGDTFDAGLLNGPRGKGILVGIKADCLELKYDWTDEPIAADPIKLVIGLPRPQTARKIL